MILERIHKKIWEDNKKVCMAVKNLFTDQGQLVPTTTQKTNKSGVVNLFADYQPTPQTPKFAPTIVQTSKAPIIGKILDFTKSEPVQSIVASAKSIFENIKKAASKYKAEGENINAPIGRAMQKVPNIDLGTKTKNKFSVAPNTEEKIVNFISNFPSAMIQGYGKSLEQVSSDKGRAQLKTDAKNLPKTMSEVKVLIDQKEWQKALETAMSNTAFTVALDASDFISVGLIAKGIKAIKGSRQVAKTIVKEAIEEAEEKIVKTAVVNIKPKIKPKAPTGVGGEIGVKAKPPIQPKTSGVAKQIEAKAVEKSMVDKGYSELAQYDSSTIKAQSKAASKYTIDDMNKIATGETPLPKELKPGTPLSIAEDYAIKNNDTELLRKLANSPLASQISESASELSLSRMRDTNSPVKIMREVAKVKEEAFKKRYGGKSVKEVSDKVVSDIKKKVKPPDKYDWNNFIKSLPTC